MYFLVLQRLLIEFILDFFYFPVWWYTGGVAYALQACGNLISSANGLMAPGLWLKNIFVPMFGQHDWQGRMVSFLVRLANVIFRSLAMVVWLLVVFILFLFWVALPLFVGYMLIISSGSV